MEVLFGMLTQPEEGACFLEDLGSTIRLDLTRAQTYNVSFTEGSQVVVQGELVGGVFRVQVSLVLIISVLLLSRSDGRAIA